MKFQIKDKLSGIKDRYFSSEEFEERGHETKSLVKWFVILAIIGGLLIIMLSPPFTAPDENCHYINVCRIINGYVFPSVENNEVGCYVTEDQNNFLSHFYGKYDGIGSDKFNFWEAYFQGYLEFNGDGELFYSTRLATINPISYLFSATGAGIAKNILGIKSPYTLLMFAKFFNLLFYVIVTAVAIRKTPVLKRTMLLIALMPMTLYQCASASYDALIIPCSFLLFAYSLKLVLSEDDYRISKEDVFAICFACAFMFAGKIAYAPLVLLLLAINIKKFGNLKRYFSCIGAIAGVALVFYLIPTMICNGISSGCTNTSWEIVDRQRESFMSNVFIIFPVLKNTVAQSFGFWATSFFGNLGNLDTQFPIIFTVIYYFILFVVGLTELSLIKEFSLKARLLSFAGCVIFFVGTIISLYTMWTPLVTGEVGGNYSTGFQGRYLIPVFLFAVTVLSNPSLRKFKHKDAVVSLSTDVVKITTLSFVVLTSVLLLTRFWI